MKPTIKPVLETDLPAICAIEQRAFCDPWPPEAFSDFVIKNGWLLDLDGQVAGYIFYHFVIDEAVIINFAVDPAYQGQNYGQFLLSASMQLLINRGVKYFFLDVRRSNLPAIGLYHKVGFQSLGFRKDYYHDPVEDAIVMGLNIPEKQREVSDDL